MSFTELAQAILRDAATLDEFVRVNNLPPPSFNVSGPARTAWTTKEAIHAQASLLANTHRLLHLGQGPAAAWMGTMNGGAGDAMTAAAIYHFDIANHVPIDGEAPFEEVAQKVGLALRDFKFVVRYAMTNFVFCEPRVGYIAHTAASKVLKENRLIASLTGMGTNEIFPGLIKEIEALEKHPGSDEPTESGWALANNAHAPMFEELARYEPKRAETFAFAIEALGTMMPDSVIVDN
jgi:hypothetical protein